MITLCKPHVEEQVTRVSTSPSHYVISVCDYCSVCSTRVASNTISCDYRRLTLLMNTLRGVSPGGYLPFRHPCTQLKARVPPPPYRLGHRQPPLASSNIQRKDPTARSAPPATPAGQRRVVEHAGPPSPPSPPSHMNVLLALPCGVLASDTLPATPCNITRRFSLAVRRRRLRALAWWLEAV